MQAVFLLPKCTKTGNSICVKGRIRQFFIIFSVTKRTLRHIYTGRKNTERSESDGLKSYKTVSNNDKTVI